MANEHMSRLMLGAKPDPKGDENFLTALGRVAYGAYCAAHCAAFPSLDLVAWHWLDEGTQIAWINAAVAAGNKTLDALDELDAG